MFDGEVFGGMQSMNGQQNEDANGDRAQVLEEGGQERGSLTGRQFMKEKRRGEGGDARRSSSPTSRQPLGLGKCLGLTERPGRGSAD